MLSWAASVPHQKRILEWVAAAVGLGSSWLADWTAYPAHLDIVLALEFGD